MCQQFLQKKVQELGNIAKQASLHPASDMPEEISNISNTSTTTAASTCADEMEIENKAIGGMATADFEHISENMNNEISYLETPPQVPPNVPVSPSESVSIYSSRQPPHCTKYNKLLTRHRTQAINWDAERKELHCLNTTWLVDVFEQSLHSKQNS